MLQMKTEQELAELSDMQVEEYYLDLEEKGQAKLVDGKFQLVNQ